MSLSSRRIFVLGFLGMFLGLLLGGLSTMFLSIMVEGDFAQNHKAYDEALKNLQISAPNFLEVLKLQKTYNLLLAVLSPLISYMAPHLLGGALFGLLWLLAKPQNLSLSFPRVLECTAISLSAIFWHILPGIGPLIALVMIMLNISRSLAIQYQLVGFMKVLGIISAVYLCSSLASASLQLLAMPLSEWLWQ